MDRIEFRHNINGNFVIYVSYCEGFYSVLRVYSYGVLILQRMFSNEDGEWNAHPANVADTRFYSVTTRRHQGIAFAIDNYFTAHGGKCYDFLERIKRARSLTDVRRIAGYCSVKSYT